MAENKITIELDVEGNAKIELKAASDAVIKFGKDTEEAAKKSSAAFQVFQGVLSADLLVAGLGKIKDAALKLFDVFITQGIHAAQEQENAINRLNSALLSAGQFTPQASKELQEFATQLQRTTKFADETTLEVASLIESLAGLDSKGLQRATKAAIDLASALKKDVSEAALIVAKAAEGNVIALGKLGIQIKKGTSDSQTFANALDELEKRFGGRAVSDLNTFSGSIAAIANNFNDLQESAGNAVIKNGAILAVLKEVNKILVDLQDSFQRNGSSVSDFITQGVLKGIDALSLFVSGIEATIVSFLKLEQIFVGAQGTISAFTDNVTFGMTEAGKRAEESAVKFAELGKTIQSLEAGNTSFDAIQEKLQLIKDAAEAGAAAAENENAIAENADQQKAIRDERRKAALEEQLQREQEVTDKRVQQLLEENQKLSDIGDQSSKNRISVNQFELDLILENERAFSKSSIAITQARARETEKIEKERVQVIQSALSGLAQFQNSKVKELAAIGKVAAIANATISTYEGAAKALAVIPFPFGFVAAAAVVAAGLANVAKIAGVDLVGGIDEVPAGFANDSFRANLSSGERVVPADTNVGLKQMIEDSKGQKEILSAIYERLGNLEHSTVVNIGNRELVNTMQDSINAGRRLYL